MKLFDDPNDAPAQLSAPKAVSYYPTPGWFAHMLFEQRIAPYLNVESVILEPSCGDGSLLRAIPANVRAFGVELDPVLAAEAAATSGHHVVVGDVLTAPFPEQPTMLFANPPFSMTFVDRLLNRIYFGFAEGGRASMILPAYMLQTSRTVAAFAARWSIEAELIPRDLFPNLSKSLVFASFVREQQRRFVGLSFYLETAAWQQMPERFHEILARARKNVWVAAILEALTRLGGTGTIESIHRIVAGSPPTQTPWVREAIRKWAREAFECVGNATYRIPESPIAA